MRHLPLLPVVLTIGLVSLMGPAGPRSVAAQEASRTATPAGTAPPFAGETFVGQTVGPETLGSRGGRGRREWC
jgi:hypothetical protein